MNTISSIFRVLWVLQHSRDVPALWIRSAKSDDDWNIVNTADSRVERRESTADRTVCYRQWRTKFNVIYAENDDMAKGAVAALDKANISHGVGKDVIVMGFDCNSVGIGRTLEPELEL